MCEQHENYIKMAFCMLHDKWLYSKSVTIFMQHASKRLTMSNRCKGPSWCWKWILQDDCQSHHFCNERQLVSESSQGWSRLWQHLTCLSQNSSQTIFDLAKSRLKIYPQRFPNASAVTWSLVLQMRNLAHKIEEFSKCDDFSGEISSAHR
jgi:hypothetical protein